MATHFGRLRVVDPASALVPGTAGPPTWVLYAAAAVAVLLGLPALRWILAQLARRPPTRRSPRSWPSCGSTRASTKPTPL
ncbi:hypothetical protein SAMN05421837_102771 [Amycolatopsis pretoriensis]|uniref:Uncharacterized protein n=1 Tax=Amycolatopsis pretoriensis TaxID=218821 RepID=A0A1H5QEM8_9PSEU|nr:hypothetical protein [Amycolatopsis pretoriensis]SEF24570.1 hypothetical protein SAMN05421837_102771 [Amycolatopsis pretoriensis]